MGYFSALLKDTTRSLTVQGCSYQMSSIKYQSHLHYHTCAYKIHQNQNKQGRTYIKLINDAHESKKQHGCGEKAGGWTKEA